MACFQFEPVPTKGEDDEEKSSVTPTPVLSEPERHERMLKTIFAAFVFMIVWGGGLLTWSVLEPEEGPWSS